MMTTIVLAMAAVSQGGLTVHGPDRNGLLVEVPATRFCVGTPDPTPEVMAQLDRYLYWFGKGDTYRTADILQEALLSRGKSSDQPGAPGQTRVFGVDQPAFIASVCDRPTDIVIHQLVSLNAAGYRVTLVARQGKASWRMSIDRATGVRFENWWQKLDENNRFENGAPYWSPGLDVQAIARQFTADLSWAR
jgi:hypothetical protein